jgi:hypothetical protein
MYWNKQLYETLSADGHHDICKALIDGKTPRLDDDRKQVLTDAAAKVRSANAPSEETLRNALVEVSTSGWGNESETTLPGNVISSSERRP